MNNIVKYLVTIDRVSQKILTAFCMTMLFAMVVFTVYTVYMRYVIENPPVWGDLLTVLSNIWLVFIALSITVREKNHIALNMVYEKIPLRIGFAIQQFWTILIFGVGIVIAVYGVQMVATMGGKYWEMWYLTWENNSIVFKPNYMPKKYAVAIMPLAGVLVAVSAVIACVEDVVKYKNGTFKVAGDLGDESE